MQNNTKEVLAAIREYIKACNSQQDAARRLHISDSYLSEILKGRRAISERIARKFGFEWRLCRVGE